MSALRSPSQPHSWHCHAPHATATPGLVLGGLPRHDTDARHERLAISTAARCQTLRDGIPDASQAACRDGPAGAGPDWHRVAGRSGRDVRRRRDAGRGARTAPQDACGRHCRSATSKEGSRPRPESTLRPASAAPWRTRARLHRRQVASPGHPEP